MTTYNSSQYLADCIQSILNQSYKNYEFLIIDDGSTDNTKEIIDLFSSPKISYKKIEHVGRSKALNIGLKLCKYDWVALIDADDIAHPKRLGLQFSKKSKINSIVITSCVHFFEKKILFMRDVSSLKLPKDLILHQKFPNSVLYNRYFILENGGYNEELSVAEDYELWLRIKNNAKFVVINKSLMFIRNSPASLSRKSQKMNSSTIFKIQEKYYKNLELNFGIETNKEQNIYLGWREYFFGNPKLARKYWLKKLILFFDIRIFIAFFVTYLHRGYVEKIKSMQIKLKLLYLKAYLLGNVKIIQTEFDDTLKRIENKS